MTSPATALLWEQWRRTWVALPLTAIVAAILLAWIPGLVTIRPTDLRWPLDITLLFCAVCCVAVQSEGGRRNGAIPDRVFTLPVPSSLLGSVPLLLCCAVVALTGGALYALITLLWKEAPYPFWKLLLHPGIMAILFAATLSARNIPALRYLLAVLLSIVFFSLRGTDTMDRPLPLALFCLGAVTAGCWLSSRQLERERHGQGGMTGPVREAFSRALERLTALRLLGPVPSRPSRAQLWYELKGGSQLALSLLALLLMALFTMAGTGIWKAGLRLLQEAGIRTPMATGAWIMIVAFGTVAAAVSVLAHMGSSLVGTNALFDFHSPEHRFVRTRPVSSRSLATTALQSLTLQALLWALCVGSAALFIALWGSLIQNGLTGLRTLLYSYAGGQDMPRIAAQTVSIAALMCCLGWVFTGLLTAITLTGRRWVGNSLLGAAMVVAGLEALNNLLISDINLQAGSGFRNALHALTGCVFLLGSLVPLLVSFARGTADRRWLAILTILWAGMVLIIFAVQYRWSANPPAMSLFRAGLYALPLAPLGLIPLATAWGRAQ